MAYIPEYSLNPYIVGTQVNSQFSTIQSAISRAVADGATNSNRVNIYIKPGLYTENITGAAGINIISLSRTPQVDEPGTVVISGKISASFSGSMEISGCEIITNSDFFLSLTGSSATIVSFHECYLKCLNNTGINHTSSNSSSSIYIDNCESDIQTTGITLYSKTSPGTIFFSDSDLFNSGNSTTSSSDSAGGVELYRCTHLFPIATSGTASILSAQTGSAATNLPVYTLNGSGASGIEYFFANSGNAPCISIGASGNATVSFARLTSSNTNVISGSGTLIYGDLVFGSSGVGLQSTLSLTSVATSNVSKVFTQVFAASGTYTPTTAMKYCIVECIGGGGGGGGAAATGATEVSVGSGGAQAGYAKKTFSAAQIGASQSVTVGTGGAGGIGNASGVDGNDSLFGALLTGEAGTGGTTSGAGALVATGGSDGGDGGGGDINIVGGPGLGGFGIFSATGIVLAGAGGSGAYGAGGEAPGGSGAISDNGNDGHIYGGGGSGACNTNNQTAKNGGSGANGGVIITEFC